MMSGLKYRDNKFYAFIGLNIPDLKPVFKFSEGCLGIDTNPDGLAVVEIGKDGNLLKHTVPCQITGSSLPGMIKGRMI